MMDLGFGVLFDRIKESELPKLLEWRNNQKVFKYTRQFAPLHPAAHEEWFKRQSCDSSMSMFSIHSGSGLVGICGLTSIDQINRRAEFSLYIGPEHHKKGFGKMALKSLLSYGFNSRGLNLIWGETFDGNPACTMFEAVGMTKHGTRPDFYFRDGKFIGAHLYGITEKEWKSLNSLRQAS